MELPLLDGPAYLPEIRAADARDPGWRSALATRDLMCPWFDRVARRE